MIFPSNSVLADSKMSSIPDMSGDNTELSIEEAVQDEHGEFSEEEKKMHEGFMREAIKMVGFSCTGYYSLSSISFRGLKRS